jgi:hypothetical protein
MPAAVCMIRPQPHYRREAFASGLAKAGYSVTFDHRKPNPGDVLVIWNRYAHYDRLAKAFEAARASVLVVENGWVGDQKHFAIARSHHNGAGTWVVGTEDRWSALDLALKPWRRDGEHILVLPQRGIGEDGVAMPAGWAASAYARLRQRTRRPIRVRPHPGREPHPPLDPDFENCWAAVTWGSGAAIHAIVAGIPVFHELPKWIGGRAASFGIDRLEEPFLDDRRPMLERLAWAQWNEAEVAAGEPFRWLLT